MPELQNHQPHQSSKQSHAESHHEQVKIKPKAEEIISKELAGFIARMSTTDQGPVVQSIVSLTSLLRGQLVKCFMTLSPNTLIFFVEKMREAFAHCKSFSHFFNKK